MEARVPMPLRIVKATPTRKPEFSKAPNFSCPPIPRRYSSLRGHSRQLSDESGTSTKTPPLHEYLERLQIPKTRRAGAGRLDEGFRCEARVTDRFADSDEEDMEVTEVSSTSGVGIGNKGFPRVFSSIGFRSWGSLMRHLSMDSAGNHIGRRTSDNFTASYGSKAALDKARRVRSTSLTFPSPVPSGLEEKSRLAPKTVAVTEVDVKVCTLDPVVGVKPMSIWATVEISAHVHSDEHPPGCLAPLDVVIILDSVPRAEIPRLRQLAISALAVVSSLMIDIDHFAIAYIDGHAVNGFRIILPLGTHTAEAARSAIETYSLHQFHSESSEATDLYNVILQLSRMFSFSERAAICQSFLITATPTMCLRMPMIEKGMGFHTISPDHCVPFYGSAIPRGWHIFYDADGGGKDSGEGDLKAKVAKVVEHLRAGFDPGVVTNLKLDFIPGEDCEIQSVLGPRKLATLRPGEKWTVPIQTSVPAASLDRAVAEIDGCAWQHSTPAMKELMAQVDQLLKEYSRENITDYIMLAQLEYRHSLLPPDSTVHVERYCHVTRKEEASDKSWDICKPQRTREVSG